MAKGLDIGTMNIVCAEKQGNSTVFGQQKNAYLEVDQVDLTRSMFSNANFLFMETGNKIHILGEDAVKMGNMLKRRTKRSVKSLITPEDNHYLPMFRLIVQRILSPPASDKEILCLSHPAIPVDAHMDVGYHIKVIRTMAEKWGYSTTFIDKGLAVVYSELGKDKFTGIGINVGAGFTTVTLAHRAEPVLSFSLARGGDWIEEEVEAATGLKKEKVSSIKEGGFSLNSEFELGSIEGALSIYYEALIKYIIGALNDRLRELRLPPADAGYPVALAGENALAEGFTELFEKKLAESKLPINIAGVKKAEKPVYSVARGCLIAALTEEEKEKAKIKPSGRTEVARIRELEGEIFASSFANKVCVSSDGVEIGTVHNITINWDTGSLKDLVVKPKSGGYHLGLNTQNGLYTIPFENVKPAEDFIVINTLSVE